MSVDVSIPIYGVKEAIKILLPIFLTTVTTAAGLSPLMLEQSFQARFLIPMAISLVFGLLSSTVLTLFALPAVVVVIDDLVRAFRRLWNGRADVPAAQAEPPAA